MPKDKKALIFYFVASLVLWQFGTAIRDICLNPVIQLQTANDPFISLVSMKNTGGAFSILQDCTNFFIIFGITALLAITFYVCKKIEFKDKLKILLLTTLSAGILGNLVERLENGYVTDFIQLNFVNFAVFNFFDVLITTSIILYVLSMVFEEIKKLKRQTK